MRYFKLKKVDRPCQRLILPVVQFDSLFERDIQLSADCAHEYERIMTNKSI